MSRDVLWLSQLGGGGATGVSWVQARGGGVQHLQCTCQPPHKNYLSPDANCAEVRKPCSNPTAAVRLLLGDSLQGT